MRIGLVIQHFDPHRGGAEHWTYQFALRLLAGGHEVARNHPNITQNQRKMASFPITPTYT